MSAVTLNNIVKRFGNFTAVHRSSLEIAEGAFVTLLGPSGCGKTTNLRMIAGLLDPTEGEILIGGKRVNDVPIHKRNLGLVFQNYALFPHKTVAENVAFGLKYRDVPSSDIPRRVQEALELVQLPDVGDRYPKALSGGQQQRIALARAIVIEPDVLLLDEPLSALDKSLRVDMQIELKRIQRDIGITTIFVTHDQEEALTLSDRIGILRAGRIVQVGPPREVYDRPVDAFAAGFLGEANWIPDSCLAGLDLPASPQGHRFAVRPEALAIGTAPDPARNALRGRLVQRVFAGAMATCLIEVEGSPWKLVARDRDIPDLPGAGEVWLSWAARDTIAVPA